jgi:phage terminase large subunit
MLQKAGSWPPDYVKHIQWRAETLRLISTDKDLLQGAQTTYLKDPAQFIDDWVDTIDPRNASSGQLVRMPFRLFPRQFDLIDFFHDWLGAEAHGLVEKSRDMGASWSAIAYAFWLFLWRPGSSVGFGSRKAQLVDRIGDMDSLFEKIRHCVNALPPMFKPRFDASYMKLINLDNGATITGESGDEIGRGGRKLIYFVDEAAHLEHPELIEAALSENTRVRIDISSVNGIGNVFHRRREAGEEWTTETRMRRSGIYVFTLDWRDHPAKDDTWYRERETKFKDEGLLHVFRQEVDRDYSAAIANAIIHREWIQSAIDAHIKLKLPKMEDGAWIAGLDVADGGGDRNALIKRKGVVLKHADEWGERDTGITARRAVDACRSTLPIKVYFDCIGVGSGVKAETNRLLDEKIMPKGMRFVPWDAGSSVLQPDKRVISLDKDSPLNKDFYANLKAQGWWNLRRRFELTHRAVSEKIKVSPDDMISLDSNLPRLRQIEKELTQPTTTFTGRMRLVVEKTPEGTPQSEHR